MASTTESAIGKLSHQIDQLKREIEQLKRARPLIVVSNEEPKNPRVNCVWIQPSTEYGSIPKVWDGERWV